MTTLLLPIGDFSRMTYLTVKALRRCQERGLLAPVWVDPSAGYRYYSPDQLPIAQVIRRLRDLGMPLDEVADVVRVEQGTDRESAMVAHLQRLRDTVAQTQASVDSLRALLENPAGTVDVVATALIAPEPAAELALTQLGRADATGIVQDGTVPDGTAIRWSFRDIAADSFQWCDERSSDGRTWLVAPGVPGPPSVTDCPALHAGSNLFRRFDQMLQ